VKCVDAHPVGALAQQHVGGVAGDEPHGVVYEHLKHGVHLQVLGECQVHQAKRFSHVAGVALGCVEAGVFNGDSYLVGKGGDKADVFLRKVAWRRAVNGQHADDLVPSDERHTQPGANV